MSIKRILERLGNNIMESLEDDMVEEIERRTGISLVYKDKVIIDNLSDNQIAFKVEDELGVNVLTLKAIMISEKGEGKGTRVMENLERIAKEYGIDVIRLEAFPPGGAELRELEKLVDWYKNLGYEPYVENELKTFFQKAKEVDVMGNVWYYSVAVNNPVVGTSERTFWFMKEL